MTRIALLVLTGSLALADPGEFYSGAFEGPPPEHLLVSRNETMRWVRILGDRRWRHGDIITALVIGPDESWIASASHDGTVRVWDTARGVELRRYVGHRGPVTSLASSPDGTIVSGGMDGTVRVWRSEPTVIQATRAQDSVTGVVVTPAFFAYCTRRGLVEGRNHRGKLLWTERIGAATAMVLVGDQLAVLTPRGTIEVRAVTNGELSQRLKAPRGHFGSIAATPRADTLAGRSTSGESFLWTLGPKTKVTVYRTEGDASASAVAVGQGAKWIAWGCDRVHAGPPGEVKRLARAPSGVTCLASSVSFLASGYQDGSVHVWRADGWKQTTRNRSPVVCVSSSGRHLAEGTSSGMIRLRATSTGHIKHAIAGHKRAVATLTFDATGKTLFSAACGDGVATWSVETGEALAKLEIPDLFGAAMSPDGSIVATCTISGRITIRELASGRILRVRETRRPTLELAFGPDLRLACGCRNGVVAVFDAALREIRTHKSSGAVWALRFDRTGNHLAWGTSDGSVGVWDLRKRSSEPIFARVHKEHVLAVGFGSEGSNVFSVGRTRLIAWRRTSSRLTTADSIRVDGGAMSLAVTRGRVWLGCVDSTVCGFELVERTR